MVKLEPKTRQLQVDEVTWEGLKYAKQRTHKSIKAILGEFVKNLVQVMATSDVNDCNLEYEVSMFPERTLKVRLTGQSSFVIGATEKELEAETKRHFQEVRLDIAEINDKAIRTTEIKAEKKES